MRSPPPASSPPLDTCGATVGDRAWSIFYFTASWRCLAAPRATLIDLPRLYTDERFRARTIARVRDPITARFWMGEYPQYDERYRAEAAGPILNKVGQLAASPALRAILGQHTPKFDLAHAMEHRGILIANLAKGRIGEQAANLLGSLLISHLQLVAMGRSAQAPENRVPFFAHIDEFQSFGTDAFASLLSEARKFAAHFCLANQYIDQLDPSVRAAVLGNAGALLVIPRLGPRRRYCWRRSSTRCRPANWSIKRPTRRGCAAASATNMSICCRGSTTRWAGWRSFAGRAGAISAGRANSSNALFATRDRKKGSRPFNGSVEPRNERRTISISRHANLVSSR